MRTVRDILRTKGSKVYSISPDATVYEALELMAKKNVGAILVLEGKKLVGMISERDYSRKTILQGRLSRETAVHEIMTTAMPTVHPHDDIEECMELFTDKHIRHLAVIEKSKVVGIVSIGDIVKSIIDYKDFIIEEMENYIKGKH
ncbi:MAG: CBS domain-containing protein [Desulfobacterales bacterium]|jgi:CBS domain-containing protein